MDTLTMGRKKNDLKPIESLSAMAYNDLCKNILLKPQKQSCIMTYNEL